MNVTPPVKGKLETMFGTYSGIEYVAIGKTQNLYFSFLKFILLDFAIIL